MWKKPWLLFCVQIFLLNHFCVLWFFYKLLIKKRPTINYKNTYKYLHKRWQNISNHNLVFSDGDGGSHSRHGGGLSPVYHLPADFFHPAAAAHPSSPGNETGDRGPSRLASPASWASLRSPGANSKPLSSQVLWTDGWIRVFLDGWTDRRVQNYQSLRNWKLWNGFIS